MVEMEQEGEHAADFLEEFLDIADIDGDLDIAVANERPLISITSELASSNLRLLSDPETVSALQEVTRLAVQIKTSEISRVILDVSGSRKKREEELEFLVEKTLQKIEETDKDQHLEPMTSYERKIVHDLVAEAGYVSESEGQGKDRHIVVKNS
jgi:spoIIIJ-associated protein